MAGRGTDIKLGGNKDFLEEKIIHEPEEFKKCIESKKFRWSFYN